MNKPKLKKTVDKAQSLVYEGRRIVIKADGGVARIWLDGKEIGNVQSVKMRLKPNFPPIVEMEMYDLSSRGSP